MAVQARFGGGLTGRRHATLSAKGLSPADLTINLRGAAPWPGLHCTQQPPAVVVAGDAMQLQLQLQIDAFAILPCFLSFFFFFHEYAEKLCIIIILKRKKLQQREAKKVTLTDKSTTVANEKSIYT